MNRHERRQQSRLSVVPREESAPLDELQRQRQLNDAFLDLLNGCINAYGFAGRLVIGPMFIGGRRRPIHLDTTPEGGVLLRFDDASEPVA